MGSSIRRYGVWIGIALVGAVCWGVLALSRGETVNAGWLLFAAIPSYATAYRLSAGLLQETARAAVAAGVLLVAAIAPDASAYRFYARFIQKKVLETDDSRATPAERLNNGRDFEPTDRRGLLGPRRAALPASARAARGGAAGSSSGTSARPARGRGRSWGPCSRPRWGSCRG